MSSPISSMDENERIFNLNSNKLIRNHLFNPDAHYNGCWVLCNKLILMKQNIIKSVMVIIFRKFLSE